MKNLQLPRSYVMRICSAVIITIIALTMTLSIETILHTSISVHRYLMGWVTFVVLGLSAYAIFLCWRASAIDTFYTVRKTVPLVLAVFPIYVFIFQSALCWMWAF